jgi:hypothetical protein
VSLVYALIHIPVFILGTMLYGLQGAIWSIVAAGVLYISLNAWMLYRTLGVTPREILHQLQRPLMASAVMVIVVRGVSFLPFWHVSPEGSWWSLVSKVVVGGVVYGGVLFAAWRLAGRPPGIERRVLQLAKRTD